MSVNSAAVLRLTGRGGGQIVGAPRGRSTSRGRGKNETNIIGKHPVTFLISRISSEWILSCRSAMVNLNCPFNDLTVLF